MPRAMITAFCVSVGVCALSCEAQTVLPHVRVSSGNELDRERHHIEPAVVAARNTPNELVVGWRINPPSGGPMVGYAISVDGGTSLNRGTFAPPGCLAPAETADPMVAASISSDDLFLGALAANSPTVISGYYVQRRPAGSSSFVSGGPTVVVCDSAQRDKGLMDLGPGLSGGERLHIVDYARIDPCPLAVWRIESTDSLGLTWGPKTRVEPPPPTNCAFQGLGACPWVMRSGQSQGRLRVAYCPGEEGDGGATAPHLAYIDLDGLWQPTNPNAIIAGEINYQLGARIQGSLSASVAGTFQVWPFPSLRGDPSTVDRLYVAFAGYVESSGGDGNVDIFVARSLNGGQTFLDANILRLTDSMLGDPAGTDQFMPWIDVDQYGGINLIYYKCEQGASTSPAQVELQARYARIANFTSPGTTLPKADLSPVFLADLGPHLGNGNQFIGDYQMIAASGCTVYCAFMSTEEGNAQVYLTKITLPPCVYDADQDGLLGMGDPPAYALQYLSSDPRADLTQNGTIDGTDAQRFLTSYACGCNPEP